MSDDAEPSPPAAAARPAWRRVGRAMLVACIVASVVMTVWAYLVAPHVPDAVQDVLGVVILFALAPVTAYVLLRGSRWWVRLALGIATFWVWLFWMFLVLIPIVSIFDSGGSGGYCC